MPGLLLLVLFSLLCASSAFAADIIRKCASGGIEGAYLGQGVPGLSPKLIAGTYVTQGILEEEDEPLLRYWVLMEPSEVPVADRISDWKAGAADKSAVLSKLDIIELARQTYTTISRYEGQPRLSPEQVADVLARQFATGAYGRHTTIDGYKKEFLSLVSGYVANYREAPYAAALLAAHTMRNRLDLRMGVPKRAVTDDLHIPYWRLHWLNYWDSWLRQNAMRSEVDALLARRFGKGTWNMFLLYRTKVIGCTGAAMPTDKNRIPVEKSGSAYLRSCVATPLSTAQCECLATVGENALPGIRDRAYSRRGTIPSLLKRNPVLKVVLATECGINSF
jgi:hypothetical protein